MGGCVGVTLRFPNGEIKKMNRWTNTLPWFIVNSKFIEKDLKHIKEWLLNHEEMEKDYELNKETGKYEHNMTDIYFPWNMLAPVEYGLVVVDMQKMKVYNCQNYTSFDFIPAFMASDGKEPEMKALLKDGYIKQVKIEQWEAKTQTWKKELTKYQKVKNWEHFKSLVKLDQESRFTSADKKDNTWMSFVIEYDGWEFVTFKHDYDGFAQMLETLKTDGWEFNSQETKTWAEYLDRFKKYEEE